MITKEHRSILAVGAGGASAVLFMILSQGQFLGVLLGYFTPLPLLMVGLGLGFDAALWSSGVAVLVVFLVISSLATSGLDAGLTMGLSFAVLFIVPTLMVTKMALVPEVILRKAGSNVSQKQRDQLKQKHQKLEPVVGILCFYTCNALIVLWLVYFNGPQGGLFAYTESYVQEFLQNMLPADRDIQPFLDRAPLLPALFAISWFMIFAINGIIGQSILKQRRLSLCATPIFRHFQPPGGLAILIAGFTAILASGDIALLALNLTLILAIPYFLTGLAVAHWMVGRWQMGRLPLFILYAGLFFIPFFMLIPVFVGVIDQAIDIRRLRTPSSHQENI